MNKCSYADQYKATRKPTCGCDTCNDKWMNKKYRFFLHYNKPETQRNGKVKISVHFKKACHIVDNVVCKVPTEGKVNKRQPYFVMQGMAADVVIKNNVAEIY